MGLDPSREREGFKAQVNTIPSCKADLCLKAVKEQGSSSLSPTEGILSGCNWETQCWALESNQEEVVVVRW